MSPPNEDPIETIGSLVGTGPTKELPTTTRGLRTRDALVKAARKVFERDGYLDARLSDISAEAGFAIGTFYFHFENKEQIFAAVIEAARRDMLHPGMPHVPDEEGPAAIIEASNRAYLVAYKRNAKLMKLMHQVAMIDPEFEKLRARSSRVFGERNTRRVKELQDRGLADPSLDPDLTARGLSLMVSRLAFECFALGEGRRDIEDIVAACTKLWVNGLRIPE
ncbi:MULTISPECIES: TetR/AcrR family transcriptional regulator [unclassified Mycolicibacterium]|uniref:TetR/AcrR family transcriptional regulator n=1 Tax=unclassified Mycolicibacterium TaxID=2636767 RepID=UPI0012DCDCBF|nr:MULTISPECIES: TetR/AcrR family transcriptional regulator [unclassified Mycolicibacterium]MUL84376.1 TetR/AcrR family transcriptional regulator [Mycolicibacterium sp. CBMA 329]MUL88151.1 TetR/AcrR family transcriptional regulator [Mycolicibacterium sp. CBMA 331]MUM02460.1 TetR/AcrR family transcriptional regulator [Mycolicibacterium sp. CBMA 334]MUM26003.1 TetR/AcrR family transcriptional regulator [Mycolicibacterium sp. CBMA 295]MUM39798.1 TetR/AcrR family transcriptional regulator [Mycolic